MKTIQMTIDEQLLESVDETVVELKTTRSAFIRDALTEALHRVRIRVLEEQQISGYRAQPQKLSEVEEWDQERVWGEA